MNGFFKDTLAELFDKKTVYLFFVITFIAIIITVFSGSFEMTINGSEQGVGLDELGVEVGRPLLIGVKALMSLLTFLAVLLTAGILPNMFVKGRADYFLSKPISRNALLVKKFLSVWIVYGLLISLCGLACYLVGALVYSIFSNMIFMLIGVALIELFIWLSISFFVGILTGKTVSAMTFIFLMWVSQFILSQLHSSQVLFEQFGYKMLGKIVDYIYYILPKITELSSLAEKVVYATASLNSYIVYSSIGFGVSMLFFTLILFKRKSY